ncbi:MAG TPA: TetR/AcrR family transcriptional regulator [Gemmatimonadales bacterium]|nr:TetR/AcrR family transcriptional regulator [Gemmatimonadales bacterium]
MTEATVGRRERKKEETRRRIFVSALQLFQEKGFQSTTIDDITERADVAKGTFFNYFPRKEAVIEYLAEEWLQVAEDVVARPGPVGPRLIELYAGAARAYEENPDLAQMVLRTSMQRFCCPAPEGPWRRFDELVMALIREGQASGELRSDLGARVLYGVLASCFVGALMWWFGERSEDPDPSLRDVTLTQAVATLQATALDGLKVRKEA